MNIVLLSAAQTLRPAAIAFARAELGLLDGDLLWVVSWRQPTSPLPADRHLMVGPKGPFRRSVVAELATADGNLSDELSGAAPTTDLDEAFAQESLGGAPVSTAELPETGTSDSVDTAGEAPVSTAEVPEAGTPDSVDDAGEVNEPSAKPAPTSVALQLPPLWHPRRVRAAVAWRKRRVRRAMGWRVRKLKRAVRDRARRHARRRLIRLALNLRVSERYAIICWRAPAVRELAGQADLIVALDAAAYRGAWALTKRVAGPAVVVGLPAGRRAREDRQAAASQ